MAVVEQRRLFSEARARQAMAHAQRQASSSTTTSTDGCDDGAAAPPPSDDSVPVDVLVEQVLRDASICPWRCLGLLPAAPTDRVRKRYLHLAKRLHPDKADHPEARDAFAAMQLAFRSMQKRS